MKSNPPYAQMVRQLAAAKLNIQASEANGGGCGSDIANRIAECEALCGASKSEIKASNCVDDLTAFNESADTLGFTPAEFLSPGPANPRECQEARGNGLVIGRKDCL
jgi:hypothetical protein